MLVAGERTARGSLRAVLVLGLLLTPLVRGAATQASTNVSKQSPGITEYLVTLGSPSREFPKRVSGASGRVLEHSSSGLVWLVAIGPHGAEYLKGVAPVSNVQPSTRALVEFGGSAVEIAVGVERLGGLIIQRYENLNAIAAAVPAGKLDDLHSLPGVRRVTKDRAFQPAATRSETETR